MSVSLSCFNLIIPIVNIEKKYPGGMSQCKTKYKHGAVEWDNDLMRISVMNTIDLDELLKHWKSLGFKLLKSNNSSWNEVCVIQSLADKPTLPCDWIQIENNHASYCI